MEASCISNYQSQPHQQLKASQRKSQSWRLNALASFLQCLKASPFKLAYYCAMEGKLIDLAVLLIVAREKVLVPLTFPSEDGAGSTRRMTIRQCVKDQIVTLIFEEIKLRREFKPEEFTQVQRNIMVMRAIGLLLEVFEKAGSTIDEYRQSQKFKVCIVLLILLLCFMIRFKYIPE